MANVALAMESSAENSRKDKLNLDITHCITLTSQEEFLSITPGLDRLSPFNDNQSLGAITPDENSFLGLSKVNYDIDYSDFSADNSMAEALTPEKRCSPSPSFTLDPFSPIGPSCPVTQEPLIPSSVPLQISVQKDVVKPRDDFVLPFLEDLPRNDAQETLLDKIEATPTIHLPPPLNPIKPEYTGFSKQGSQIPSIPCNTGDFHSLECEPSSSNRD